MSDSLVSVPTTLSSTVLLSSSSPCSFCVEYACETSAMGSCGTGCQTACEGGVCQTACETGNCQSACQSTCQSDCQASAQGTPVSSSGEILSYSSTASTITIRMKALPNATEYQVAYRRTEDDTSATQYATSSSTRYTITGLSENTEYIVNYRGVNSYGSGPFMSSGEAISTTRSLSGATCKIYDGSSWRDATMYIYDETLGEPGWREAFGKIYKTGWEG